MGGGVRVSLFLGREEFSKGGLLLLLEEVFGGVEPRGATSNNLGGARATLVNIVSPTSGRRTATCRLRRPVCSSLARPASPGSMMRNHTMNSPWVRYIVGQPAETACEEEEKWREVQGMLELKPSGHDL